MAVLLGLELSGVTTVSLIIVGVIIALALVAWSFFKTYMFFFNTKAMFKQLDDCANAEDFALMTLEKYNLGQVEVKVGMVLTGYSSRKRKIYMSRFVARRSTISSISRAMQLVCLAKIDITNEAAHKKALHHTYFNYAATVVFFAMIIVNIIIAVMDMKALGIPVLIGTIIAFVLYIVSLVFVIGQSNLLKMANKDAIVVAKELGFFDEKELAYIQKLYKLSIIELTINKILAVVYLIYYFFKIIFELVKIFGNKK